MNCEQMLDHPWMKIELSTTGNLSTTKSKLSKYVSIRKEKSARFKGDKKDENDDFWVYYVI